MSRWSVTIAGCVLAMALGLAVGILRPVQAQSAPSPTTPADAPDVQRVLPWPPPVPAPRPFQPVPPAGTPPFLPPIDPEASDTWPAAEDTPPLLQDLGSVIAGLQQALDRVTRWAGTVQQAASDALARMIWEAPGYLPQGMGLPDLIGRLGLLSQDLRGALEAVVAKIETPAPPGSIDARHQAYTASNPALAHEAAGIAVTDEVLTAGAVRQDAAVRVTAEAAAAAARDPMLPATAAAARRTGATLLAGSRSLPSSRAGIELLVAGMGAGMQQQAAMGTAVADRLTVLAQQTAEVSQQVGALAATTGALTARDAERDRRALDARLGLMDALNAGGRMFQQLLAGAGEPPGSETRLDPLY